MFKALVEEHLNKDSGGCVVNRWITDLTEQEDRDVFAKLLDVTRADAKAVDLKAFYNGLLTQAINENIEIPFKMTAFRSHMRGYCTCR